MKYTVISAAVILAACILMLLACEDNEIFVSDLTPFPFDQDTIQLNRPDWHLSSRPFQLPLGTPRGRLLWHNCRELVPYTEIYDRETAPSQSAVRIFRLIFRPRTADTAWHWEPDPANQNDSIPVPAITTYSGSSWAGIFREWGKGVDDSAAFLEFRARGTGAVMHLELGWINEDVNGDGIAFNEDRPPLYAFSREEDTGLDSLPDRDEPFYHPEWNPDPNGDNFWFLGEGTCPWPISMCENEAVEDTIWHVDSIYYEYLNGTEGNLVDFENFMNPDRERLGFGFEEYDRYVSYRVDLGDPTCPFRIDRSAFSGTGKSPWYTFRLPLRDTIAGDWLEFIESDWAPPADVDLSEPFNLRIWFEAEPAQTALDTVEIAALYFRDPESQAAE